MEDEFSYSVYSYWWSGPMYGLYYDYYGAEEYQMMDMFVIYMARENKMRGEDKIFIQGFSQKT
jgi:hypothetical protein